MSAAPARKRQKINSASPAYPNTRAAAAASPASPQASGSDDLELGMDGDESEGAFEYESDHASDHDNEPAELMVLDSGEDELADSGDEQVDALVLSDSDEAPPEPVGAPAPSTGKGKLTARKQFAVDVQEVQQRHAASRTCLVKDFERDDGGDDIRFTLQHPDFPRGLRISLLFPELGGYPQNHSIVAFTEHDEGDVPEEVTAALHEVSQLPKQADCSLNGLVEFLVHRIVRGEPNPYVNAVETDEDEYAYDEDLDGTGAGLSEDSELMDTLRSDFKQLIDAGFRPGFTRISELDLVVSVAKKVSTLGVPARALEAWDRQLMSGQVVYLVLLMSFSTYPLNLDDQSSGQCRFKVGISPRYKPSRAAVAAAFRAHTSNPYTKGEFEAISLSAPLDALLNSKLGEIIYIRRSNERVGWAGAEQHCFEAGRSDANAVDKKLARAADKAEMEVAQSGGSILESDPMASLKTAQNFPLLAFSYLIRRFVMCPRFCLNCYKRCDQIITALKPFVCESPLCLFQLIALGLGPSLEHEIVTNTAAVDLLVQLTYVAAKEVGLKGDLLPVGLELQVPQAALLPAEENAEPVNPAERVDLDTLRDDTAKCAGVAALIQELPPIGEMRVWLSGEDMTDDEHIMNRTRKLVDMRRGTISISAWRLLRWIVASNTSYLKLIEDDDELIQGISKEYRQFRLVVGSPAKEHQLAESVKAAQSHNANAVKYPTLFAFHGSSVRNWSSMVLRQGLHFRKTINGRAYGHGVYFAKDGHVSLGHYAATTTARWKNAEFPIGKVAAICEVTNLPDEYVSTSPYLVVDRLEWIQARYLVVQIASATSLTGQVSEAQAAEVAASTSTSSGSKHKVKTVALDPKHPLTIGNTKLQIPDVGDKLQKLEASLQDTPEELNESDAELFREPSVVFGESSQASPGGGGGKASIRTKLKHAMSGVVAGGEAKSEGKGKARAAAPTPADEPDTFEPADEARLRLLKPIPPPEKPSRGALSMLQKEIKAMLKTQNELGPTKAGFYFDPERSHDNMFTWVVEMPRESFEEGLPLRKDMESKGVRSVLMEIRFGDTFPFSPPFFRVVHPRFLPFIHGGGGHITGGGSVCMDLLTTDGWLSVYTIDAILLQIRMAMSNLEPNPARLDGALRWNQPYTMEEAIAGFRRAAQAHGWKVPDELATFAAQG